MAIKLFLTGDKFGVTEANLLKKRDATETLPAVGDTDPHIPFLYLPEKVLKASDGTNIYNIGISTLQLTPYTGQAPIDNNNDIEVMVDVPEVLNSAKMKLLGLPFPSFFYTEYPGHSGFFWSTEVNDEHNHTGSVSGDTGNDSDSHYHTVSVDQGAGQSNTSSYEYQHDHSFNDNFTTSDNNVVHKHKTEVTFTGSTVKTTFSAAILEIYITTNRGSWGTAKSIDVSTLFNTNGTGLIDIKSHLTAGAVNYIKFHLNTAAAVGGKISYLIKIY